MKKNTLTFQLSIVACLLFGAAFIWKYVLTPTYQLYLKTQPYYVDVINGTIDGLKPTATNAEIVAKFPDYTSMDEKETDGNDGGGVFFLDKGMYFYTYRDTIDIRSEFIGNVSNKLMSKGTSEITAALNKTPIKTEKNWYWEYIRDDNSEETTKKTTNVVVQTFEMDYGKLIIESTPSRVYRLKIHYSK